MADDLLAPNLPFHHPQNVERRLRDKIERLRAEVDEQCRLNGMGGERELKWMARAENAERELAALRERIEKAPVGEVVLLEQVRCVVRCVVGIPYEFDTGKRVRLVVED